MTDKLLFLIPMYMFVGIFLTHQATNDDDSDKGHTWLYIKMMVLWLPAMIWYSLWDKETTEQLPKHE